MTRKGILSAANLNRLATVAKEQGVCVEVEVDGARIRIVPFVEAIYRHQERGPHELVTAPILPPLDHRETLVMDLMMNSPEGTTIGANVIPGVGRATLLKLEKRGYINVSHQNGEPTSSDQISVSRKGKAAMTAARKHQRNKAAHF